jgi:hypothetical protein
MQKEFVDAHSIGQTTMLIVWCYLLLEGVKYSLKYHSKFLPSCEVATLHTRAMERSISTIIVDAERVCGCLRIWSNYDVDLVVLRAPLGCKYSLKYHSKFLTPCVVATLLTRAVERSIPTIIVDGERVCACLLNWSNYYVDYVVLRAPLGCNYNLKYHSKFLTPCEVAILYNWAVEWPIQL